MAQVNCFSSLSKNNCFQGTVEVVQLCASKPFYKLLHGTGSKYSRQVRILFKFSTEKLSFFTFTQYILKEVWKGKVRWYSNTLLISAYLWCHALYFSQFKIIQRKNKFCWIKRKEQLINCRMIRYLPEISWHPRVRLSPSLILISSLDVTWITGTVLTLMLWTISGWFQAAIWQT